MGVIRRCPGKGVDEMNYPIPDYPHYEQSQARARVGEILVERQRIAEQIDEKMRQYFILVDSQ